MAQLDPITTDPTTPEPSEIFNHAWQAYKDSDWDSLMNVYAPDAELVLPGTAPIKGRGKIVKTWRQLKQAFPDDGGTYSQVISEHNVASGQKVYSGTNTGPLPMLGTDTTLPPTGKRISITEADFIVVEDGQVIKHTCYYDRLDYAAQLGIMG